MRVIDKLVDNLYQYKCNKKEHLNKIKHVARLRKWLSENKEIKILSVHDLDHQGYTESGKCEWTDVFIYDGNKGIFCFVMDTQSGIRAMQKLSPGELEEEGGIPTENDECIISEDDWITEENMLSAARYWLNRYYHEFKDTNVVLATEEEAIQTVDNRFRRRGDNEK